MKPLLKGIAFLLLLVSAGVLIEGSRAGLTEDQLAVNLCVSLPVVLLGGGLLLFLLVSALRVIGKWPTKPERDEQERLERDFRFPEE